MIDWLRRPWQFWFEWGITVLLIAGVVLTSFNVYPLNIWILLISNVGWQQALLFLGFVWIWFYVHVVYVWTSFMIGYNRARSSKAWSKT